MFIPLCQACVAMLLQKTGMRASSNSLPPMDLLSFLGALCDGIEKIKAFFNDEFTKILNNTPNAIPVCRESRKRSVRAMETSAREALHAFSMAVMAHIEKQLSSLQSRYDYCPKSADSSILRSQLPSSVSIACSNTCKSLLAVFTSVKQHTKRLWRLNLPDLFIKPLCQQFMGVLITHIKKSTISNNGAVNLIRDIDEYYSVQYIAFRGLFF